MTDRFYVTEFLEKFYRKNSIRLFALMVITLPALAYVAATIPTNNDIETWLPSDSALKIQYDQFRDDFGTEEMILLGLKNGANNKELIASLASRIERHAEIETCWTTDRLQNVMSELCVSNEEIAQRVKGVSESSDGKLQAILLHLSHQGAIDRTAAMNAIHEELNYCQIQQNQYALAGGPVIVTELDRLGGQKNNQKFFLLTLAIGFLLLLVILKDLKTSTALIVLTIWSIQLTTSCVKWCGGEMNFILGALPVMVMVFTLAASIHYLHYFDAFRASKTPVASSLLAALKPCVFATCTTTIGLASLCLSDIMPVRQFGYAASVGCVVSLFCGLLITPAIVNMCRFKGFAETNLIHVQRRIFASVIEHRKKSALVALLLVAVTAFGLPSLTSRLEPLEFLPSTNKVVTDLEEIQHQLTTTSSLEIVVDFGDEQAPFLDRIEQVQAIEKIVRTTKHVRHTTSAASFFPAADQMPESTREIGKMLQAAKSQANGSDYITCGQRLWRISARIEPEAHDSQGELVETLKQKLSGYNVIITGISPLIKQAQQQIFDGFWKSFGTAFLIITVVMILTLRSPMTGLVAMVPNLTPLVIVFGFLGWCNIPLDIGMMMTGSIALGIAVDGTFHFLVKYEQVYRKTNDAVQATAVALDKTGPPIAEAAFIAAIGMLALCCSDFGPTARFGMLMSALLVAALIGDLVLLPALLAMRPKKAKDDKDNDVEEEPSLKHVTIRHPHFIKTQLNTEHTSFEKEYGSIIH